MSEQNTTNLDLETAKQLAIQEGFPGLARAFQFQSEGMVNLFQGVLGQSFLDSVERVGAANKDTIGGLFDEKLLPLVNGLQALHSEVGAGNDRFQTVINKVEDLDGTVGALTERFDALNTAAQARYDNLEHSITALNTKVDEQDTAQNQRLDAIEALLTSISNDVLVKELDRRARLENVRFLEALKQRYPDLAEAARAQHDEAP